MATVAGIRNADFLGELGVWDAETVIVPGVALHVGGDGHVAGNALVSSAFRAVVAVGSGIDDGGGGEIRAAAGVAVHAELVPGGDELVIVRVMAIGTTDAGVVHAAGEK